jgi:hypothetical protein
MKTALTLDSIPDELKAELKKYPEDWEIVNPSLLVATFFDSVTAIKLMKEGKIVSRRGNPSLAFKIRKGIMDTGLLEGLIPLGFPKELYDHGDRGCEYDWRWRYSKSPKKIRRCA